MQLSEVDTVAARYVPGVGTPKVQRLSAGLVNETYRVVRDGTDYALRLTVAQPFELGIDRAWEVRVLHAAVGAGLAAAVAYVDPRRGILISRWVDGRSWSATEVRQPLNIHRVADLLRRIHALPVPTPTRVMSPGNWIDRYEAASACADPELRTAAAVQLAELARLGGAGTVLCHGDLHCLNLLETRQSGLVLLDWEYAHASNPCWDLAGWVANNDLDSDAARELLESYQGRAATSEEFKRLGLFCGLYDYVCLLWSRLYLSRHADNSHAGERRCEPAADGIAVRAQLLAARLEAKRK